MVEAEMRLTVAKWMLSRGLIPVVEVPEVNCCDMVGVKFDESERLVEMIAVELKIFDAHSVIGQCTQHMPIANETWAVMPSLVCPVERFRALRIGLLAFKSDVVRVVSKPRMVVGIDLSRYRDELWSRREEYVVRMACPLMRNGSKNDLGTSGVGREKREMSLTPITVHQYAILDKIRNKARSTVQIVSSFRADGVLTSVRLVRLILDELILADLAGCFDHEKPVLYHPTVSGAIKFNQMNRWLQKFSPIEFGGVKSYFPRPPEEFPSNRPIMHEAKPRKVG